MMDQAIGKKRFHRFSFRMGFRLAGLLGLCLVLLKGPDVRAGSVPAGKDGLTGHPIRQIEFQLPPEIPSQEEWQNRAKNLIQISVQDPYDPAKLARAIERLTASGLFSSIHVPDPGETGQGVELSFDLIPFGRVKDIRISNSFPLFRQEVLNVMTLHVGDAFSAERLSRQKERLTTLYQRQGFINPRISVSAPKDPADGNYIVEVDVEKTDFYRVDQVRFQGNQQVSSARLKPRTSTWRSSILPGASGRFVKGNLGRDVKRLTDFYRDKGFAEVKIKPDVLGLDAGRQVTVVFQVQEGPLYRVRFKGNAHLASSKLKPLLGLAKAGNLKGSAMARGMRRIKAFYEEQGFPDVKVSRQEAMKEGDRGQVKDVTIFVEEGLFYRVIGVEITGNRQIPGAEIRQSLLTREKTPLYSGAYSKEELDKDIRAVRALYLQEGFTRARVEKTLRKTRAGDMPDQVGVHINLKIQEGPQTLVENLRFDGLSVLSRDEAVSFLRLTPGQPFRSYMMEEDEKSLMARISELGYPRCQVKARPVFNGDGTGVDLTFTVAQGEYIRMGQVVFVGNFRTDPSILDREMQMGSNDPFSLKKLLESRKNMLDINALDTVRFQTIGLENSGGEVDVIVSVEEKKPYFFETGAGYDTERHFYANSTVGDHNFWGQDLDVQMGAEISQIGYKGGLSVTNPRLFSSRVTSYTRIFGEDREEFNKEFGTRTIGASQKISRSLVSDNLTGSLGFAYERREQYLSTDRVLQVEELDAYDPRHVLIASPGLILRTTDSYVRPKRGWLVNFETDISKGIDDNLDDFIRYRLDTRFYFSPADPLVIALRGGYGFISPYGGSSRIPDDQLFFLGGTASVRGFDENLLRYDAEGEAVGGREIIQATIEVRYDLGLNLEGSIFYDTGAVRKAQNPGGTDDFQNTVGVGLRYMTPVGPIGFLYGWKLDPHSGEGSGRLHFSMGYTF
ncbi:outer membrane protein assembly factor BamA [Desulfospira joergensenii]|uniref:outer membrane protein assembly factor BamA n=1 Tax=Desulfospira joergensenii TaxID=53329 RepID=UPI0003B36317|nr:outer membrane protein assembly factor BamA [Desulfospira joergensenii]